MKQRKTWAARQSDNYCASAFASIIGMWIEMRFNQRPHLLAMVRETAEQQEANSDVFQLTAYDLEAARVRQQPFRVGYVIPLIADYICDVEIAVRKVVSESEWQHFQQNYCNAAMFIENANRTEPQSPEYQAVERSMRVKAGREILHRKLHAPMSYMRPVDLRGRKR